MIGTIGVSALSGCIGGFSIEFVGGEVRENKILVMNLTTLAALVFLGVAIRTLVESIKKRRREEQLNRDFANETCELLNLPREVTWHKGGVIVADLDAQGNSVLLYRRKNIAFKVLAHAGVQAGTSHLERQSSSWKSSTRTSSNENARVDSLKRTTQNITKEEGLPANRPCQGTVAQGCGGNSKNKQA